MEHPFHARELVEDGEQIGKGVAGVEHDRLADFLGQAQHLPEHVGLGLGRRPMVIGEVIIEPDLPHRHHASMARQPAQLSPLVGADGFTGRMRVPSDGGPQSRHPFGQVEARLVVAGVVTDVDHSVHAGGFGVLQRLHWGERLAQVQEVRVRIDQATGSGFSIRGNRTPARDVWVRGASLPHSRAVAQGVLRSALTCAAIFPAVSGRNGETR